MPENSQSAAGPEKRSSSSRAAKKNRRGENCTNRSKNSCPRILSDGHLLDRGAEARKRLGITKEQMEGVPRVTDKIIAGAGSIQKAVAALEADDSDDAVAFIRCWSSISKSDRRRLKLEEIAVAAGLTPRRFVEVVTGALMQQSQDVTKMLVAVAQPKVTAATVKAATDEVPIVADVNGRRIVVGKTNGDVKAQEIFHKITGMLPLPKGSQTTINMQQNAVSAKEEEERSDGPQSMDEFLLDIQDVLRPKALAAPVEPFPVNAPAVEYVDVEV